MARPSTLRFLFCLGLMPLADGASKVLAQDSLPPWEGGRTASLGQPSRARLYTAGSFGVDWRRAYSTGPVAYGAFGVTRDIGSQVVGLLALSAEGYAGFRTDEFEGGARLYFQIPILRLSFGGDYNIRDDRLGLMLGFTMPVRRGGVLQGGSLLRFELGAAPLSAFRTSVVLPVRQPFAGHTRPRKDHVDVARHGRPPAPGPTDVPGVEEPLANVRVAVRRLEHLVVPYLDRPGADPRAALVPLISELRAPLHLPGLSGPGLSVNGLVRLYHAELARAFSIAASGRPLPYGSSTPAGDSATAVARAILRDHFLYPYDRLLGQWKSENTLDAFATRARGNFARSIVSLQGLAPDREAALFHVFEQLLTAVETLERDEFRRWGDNRVVWLPLQLGLRPEDHDTQTELDAIVEAVVGVRFTDGNRIWYVVNQQFQAEVIRSIEQAEEYHVVWIHDFSGRNKAGVPDAFSLRHVVDAYYRALTRRVREYDRSRRLPVYMIFLDQHYYERTRGRLWLDLLERPLGKIPRMPPGFEDFAATIGNLQRELQAAIDGSRLVQAEVRQYGAGWLRNLVKVHVSITNPADPSFWSQQIMPLLGIPDNLMRDHRKIVFYDISEEDPYRGSAMYTGMGIGEDYMGARWEDRALMVEGPAVLSLKGQARALLESQGLTGGRVPYPLRSRPVGPEYQAAVDREIRRRRQAGGRDQRAVELHNGTGFQDKQVTAAKAVLYSLMPPGSVVKVPDSLWGSALWASLLTGSALRGCRVLFIAPSLDAAPAANWPSMGVAHDLFARLIVLQQEFGPELNTAGGMLKTGIYNPGIGVQDITARFAAAYKNGRRTPFLRRLFPVHITVDSLLSQVGDAPPARPDTTRSPPARPVMPKLHLKANFLASREGWDSLMARPEIAPILKAYIGQLMRTDSGESDVKAAAAELIEASDNLESAYRASLPPGRRDRLMYYMVMGSANADYRSMLMDGEASVLLSGWSGIIGLIDFSLIASLSVWIDDLEMLDALLPPPTGIQRVLARQIRFTL